MDRLDEEGGVRSPVQGTDRRVRREGTHAIVAGSRSGDTQIAFSLDELARETCRMIAAALEPEVADYVQRFADDRDDDGKRLPQRPRATAAYPSVGHGPSSCTVREQQVSRRVDRRA